MDDKSQNYQMQIALQLQLHLQQQQLYQQQQQQQAQYHQYLIQHSPPQANPHRTSPPSYNATTSAQTNQPQQPTHQQQQSYYQYATPQPTPAPTQPPFDNYLYQNLLTQHNNMVSNYVNYAPVQMDTTPAPNTHYMYPNANYTYLPNYHNYFTPHNNKVMNFYESTTNDYSNYHLIHQQQQQPIQPAQTPLIQQQSPMKKQGGQSGKSANSLKNIDVIELKQLIKNLSRENEANEDLSKLVSVKSSVIPASALPKYIKPKVCKSPMVIHLVNSKQVTKPQAQMAVTPPDLLGRDEMIPPQRPPPPLHPSLAKNPLSTSLPPPPLSVPPPPPDQRPVSPPNIPPPIHRNSAFSKFNHSKINDSSQIASAVHHAQMSFTPRPINNSLLNSVLNQSLNMSTDRKTLDYESSFNGSFNMLNQSNASSNYAATTTATNNNNSNTNFHAMLYSPNLMTLFDRKKQPPPPYPGKTATTTTTTTTTNNSEEMETDDSVRNLSVQSNSAVRRCSPRTFKFYMEQHVENILKHHKAREFRRYQLESELSKLDLESDIKDTMRKLLRQKETNYLRLRRTKMNKNMFEHVKVLGVGAFGEVNLVRKKDESQALYAMKILHKSDVFNRNQAAHVKAERDILAEADSEWVVKLYYSFQDEENLYFVMDYVPGGDLMNLLIKMHVFSEELARFYIGELTCAIESVHNLGFIHRDIKPDNILIDKNGHIKLTDFGLCTGFHWTHSSSNYRIDNDVSQERKKSADESNAKNARLMATSLVGTPNYIAPEVLCRKFRDKGYSKSCDWWSVGVILYEMIIGEPPFRDETALGTQNKVLNWRETLRIPEGSNISDEAKDLIFKLCTDAEKRLDADGIKSHPFFRHFDLGPNLRRSKAPHVPHIQHPTDTSNFEPIDNLALCERKARINQMHRVYQQQKQQIPHHHQQHHNPNSMNSDLTNASVNPMLYEFTFRRFFDEADNFVRYDEDNSEFSSFIKNISLNNPKPNNDTDENMKEAESEAQSQQQQQQATTSNETVAYKNKLSPSLISMMASVSTNNHDSYLNDVNKMKLFHLKESKSDFNFRDKVNNGSEAHKYLGSDKENSFRSSANNLNSTSDMNFVKMNHESLKENLNRQQEKGGPTDLAQTTPIYV